MKASFKLFWIPLTLITSCGEFKENLIRQSEDIKCYRDGVAVIEARLVGEIGDQTLIDRVFESLIEVFDDCEIVY